MAKRTQPVPVPSCGTEPSALRHEGAAQSHPRGRGRSDPSTRSPRRAAEGDLRVTQRIPMDRTARNGPRGTPPDQSLLGTTKVLIGNGRQRVGRATCRAVCAQALSPSEADHRIDRGVGAVMAGPCSGSGREIVPMMLPWPINAASDGGQIG